MLGLMLQCLNYIPFVCVVVVVVIISECCCYSVVAAVNASKCTKSVCCRLTLRTKSSMKIVYNNQTCPYE